MEVNPRIIQGKYKGRILKVPESGTRPFTDRVKKTLFDIIQGQVEGKTVLDLFAGSGNLGLEAISSGAAYVVFVDSSDAAIKIIANNIKDLKVEHYSKVIKSDYKKFILENKESYDIIFVDPPFKLIKKLSFEDLKPLMNQDTILIFKSNAKINNSEFPLQILDERKIGINYLYFLRKAAL